MPTSRPKLFAILIAILLAPQALKAAAPATQPAHDPAASTPIRGQLVFSTSTVSDTKTGKTETAEVRVYDLAKLLATEHVRWRALRPNKQESRYRARIGGVISGISGPPNMWSSEDDERTIVDLIISTVAPSTWRENGGASYIRAFNGRLWIEQTPAAHRQIEQLLSALLETAAVKSAG